MTTLRSQVLRRLTEREVEPENHCNNLDELNHRESLTAVVKGVLLDYLVQDSTQDWTVYTVLREKVRRTEFC